MYLSHKELEEMLAVQLWISPDARGAFKSRLKHLQRSGFPSDVNTGKGRPAQYGWQQILELAVCLDLIDLGIPPDSAISLVTANRDILFEAAAVFVSSTDEESLVQWANQERCPRSKELLLIVSVSSLRNGLPFKGRALEYLSITEFEERLRSEFGWAAPISVIAFSKRLLTICNYLAWLPSTDDQEKRSMQVVIQSLIAWADILRLVQ